MYVRWLLFLLCNVYIFIKSIVRHDKTYFVFPQCCSTCPQEKLTGQISFPFISLIKIVYGRDETETVISVENISII